jgi:hypothetical protein
MAWCYPQPNDRHAVSKPRPLERILREIRRRTRVVGSFPDALNLAATRLRHIAGTAWSTKRYLNIEMLEGPADKRCRQRLSHCRAPLSPNQMCEKLWTLPPLIGGQRQASGRTCAHFVWGEVASPSYLLVVMEAALWCGPNAAMYCLHAVM